MNTKTSVKKETPIAENKGKGESTQKTPVVESGKQEAPEVKVPAKELQPKETMPKPEPAKPLSMVYLNRDLEALRQVVSEHSQQIVQLQDTLARKRKPTLNHKIQIRDKQTGKVYPSKNNCYQTMLKAGELKELVDKGIFGDNPEKNTFGWYALVREWLNRFEEVKAEQTKETT